MGIDYGQVITAHLPAGQAWNGEELRKLIDAMGVELERIDDAYAGLAEEANPATATGSIDHWMTITGVLDNGYTLAQKRNAVVGQLVARGGNTLAYYKAIAYALGYITDMSEVTPAYAGRATAGDPAYDDGAAFVFFVSVLSGDMNQNGLSILVNTINKAKAAHTVAVYEFIDSRTRVGTARVGNRLVGITS